MSHPEKTRRNRSPFPMDTDTALIIGGCVLVTGVLVLASIKVGSHPFDGDGNGRDSQTYIAGLAPDQRFQHDFNYRDESGDDCLGDTGYDLYDSGHNQIVKVGTISLEGDIIVITPGEPNEYGDELRLKSDSGQADAGSRPLQPADEVSKDILELNRCNFSNY